MWASRSRAAPTAPDETPPVYPADFFEGKVMGTQEHSRKPRLPFVCAECGYELVLTSSGHQFCANPLCTDGFDIEEDWRVMTVLELLKEEKKLQ